MVWKIKSPNHKFIILTKKKNGVINFKLKSLILESRN